jgi:SsrA-binding protein
MASEKDHAPTVANRRAKFLYFIEETVEAGVMLKGSEVKAIRAGRANLTDSYVRIRDGDAYLVGLHIGPYENAGPFAHEARRERKLLLHRRELDRLGGKIREAGYTLIATKLYFNADGRLKAEIALAKGKKAHDKRQTIREREGKKEVARAMKHYKR